MKILVDHRERPSGVVDVLKERSFAVEVVELEIADYVVGRGVGVERKTVRDLHRSIATGRLWTQVVSLRHDLAQSFLVVEGVDLDRGQISAAGVRGALLQTVALGVPVIRSKDLADTVLWLERMAARSPAGTPVRPRRTRTRPPFDAESILVAIPGISQTMASALLERFGSIARIAEAGPVELTSVPGLGARRAETLVRLLS